MDFAVQIINLSAYITEAEYNAPDSAYASIIVCIHVDLDKIYIEVAHKLAVSAFLYYVKFGSIRIIS